MTAEHVSRVSIAHFFKGGNITLKASSNYYDSAMASLACIAMDSTVGYCQSTLLPLSDELFSARLLHKCLESPSDRVRSFSLARPSASLTKSLKCSLKCLGKVCNSLHA